MSKWQTRELSPEEKEPLILQAAARWGIQPTYPCGIYENMWLGALLDPVVDTLRRTVQEKFGPSSEVLFRNPANLQRLPDLLHWSSIIVPAVQP